MNDGSALPEKRPALRKRGRRGPQEGHPPLASSWCLFLDIDGTLLEHIDRPDEVVVDSALRTLLGRLSRSLDGALALISGRSIQDVEQRFAQLAIPVAGLHGVEHRDFHGVIRRHQMDEEALRSARAHLEQTAAQHPGLFFEDKGLNLAMHYRTAPEAAPIAESAIRAVARDLGLRFEIQKGKMVWEVKPSGYDKGTAIEEYLDDPPFSGRLPVFVGDDLTDEVGFELVNGRGGHSIKVGPGKTRAGWRLKDALAVRAFLLALVAHLEG
ncbi:MAG: trehalose-phosphatase [Bacillota bacterium]